MKSNDRADIVQPQVIAQVVVRYGADIAPKQFARMELREVVPIVVKVDGAADELPASQIRQKRRQIHAVVDEAGFVAGFFKQQSGFAWSLARDPIDDLGYLRTHVGAQLESSRRLGLRNVDREG